MTRRPVGPVPPREWLTTDEAAAWLGCDKKTIQRAKAAAKLNPKRRQERGGPDYYRIAELRAWVETWADA